MKKTRSVIIYPLLCSAVLLPALLSPLTVPAKAFAADSSAAAQTAATEADPAAAATASQTVPELILSKCYLLESDNYESIADGYYQAALLTEQSAAQYPALSSGLTGINTQIIASCKEDFKELAEEARQYITGNESTDGSMPSATLESRIVPVRQDEKVVSFFTSCYSYVPGAAAGTTTFKGISLDTATGKQIAPEEVLKDVSNRTALVKAINENLRLMSTGAAAGDREESVSVALASANYVPSWVISDNGMLFRFNPGAIGTYEEGPIEAEVSFNKYPDLFTDTYAAHVGAYTLPVETVYPVIADLKGDGTMHKVSLNARPSEDEQNSYTALRVAVDDKECLHETYFFNARGVLIHTADGKNYLYVQTITDNDYRITSVFDLNGETPVFKGELNGTGFSARFRRDANDADLWYLDEQFISSPDSFSLDTHMDLMSTYSATRRYKVGEDGMPSALTDEYLIDSDLELTSLTDLPADTVDPASGAVTKQSAVLPKGTKCSLYRTNGEDTVDVKAADGTVYRFTVTGDWPQKVNGLRLDQAFDGTLFAG